MVWTVSKPLFSFLSDDDFLLPTFYETALEGFKKHPDASFSAGAVIDVDDTGEVIDQVLSKWPDKEYFTPPDGLIEMIGKYSNWIGSLFRKEIIEQVGPLDLSLKAIDVDYLFRVAARFPFTISKKPCAVFVQHSSSYSGIHGFKLICPGWQIMISKLKENPLLSTQAREIAERLLNADFQNLLFMNAMRSLEKRQFEEAVSIAKVYDLQGKGGTKGFLLETSIKICPSFSIVSLLLKHILKFRRFWQRRVKRSSCKKTIKNFCPVMLFRDFNEIFNINTY